MDDRVIGRIAKGVTKIPEYFSQKMASIAIQESKTVLMKANLIPTITRKRSSYKLC